MCCNTFISDESDQTQHITIGMTLLIFLNLPVVWMHLLNIPSLQQGSWNRFLIAFKFDTHWINSKFSPNPGRAVFQRVTRAVGGPRRPGRWASSWWWRIGGKAEALSDWQLCWHFHLDTGSSIPSWVLLVKRKDKLVWPFSVFTSYIVNETLLFYFIFFRDGIEPTWREKRNSEMFVELSVDTQQPPCQCQVVY